jgi:hypothetical protein
LIDDKFILSLIQDWKTSGRPSQEAFEWSKSKNNWVKNIEEESEYIQNLPPRFGREYLRLINADSAISPVQKFLTTMIWGYGDLGYGSYRVKKMFNTPKFESIIENSFEIAIAGEPLLTYQYLARNRISQLGPAFGTKWICFASNEGNPGPIYDSFIALWVSQNAKEFFGNTSISAENWNFETYRKYLELMSWYSEKEQIKMSDFEYIIFEDALKRFSKKSKWLSDPKS